MKYRDKNTLSINVKYQSKEESFEDRWEREHRAKNKKEIKEFWEKNLKGYLSKDFWNLLSFENKSYIRTMYKTFEGTKEEFAKYIKESHKDKIQDLRQLTLKKLGI